MGHGSPSTINVASKPNTTALKSTNHIHFDFYRPKRSFGQGNIFTRVCHSVHRGGGVPDQAPPRAGTPPDQAGTPPGPGRYTPPDQAGTPPLLQAGTPPRIRQVHTPPDQAGTPPRIRQVHTPPRTRQVHPPRTADSGIRSTFGRYASYWNAFLFSVLTKMSLFQNLSSFANSSTRRKAISSIKCENLYLSSTQF